MERKPKVLFLLFEGLADTVIDAQVISHVREVSEAGIASFEVWVIAWNDIMYSRSLERREEAQRMAGCAIRVMRGVRPGIPFSAWRNGRLISAALDREGVSFTHIHARTEYSVLACSEPARRINATLILDCRGDAAAEVDYRLDLQGIRSLAKPIVRLRARRRLLLAAARADRLLFVARHLRDIAAPPMTTKPVFVIPSCASERLFFFDPELRRQLRKTLGYIESDQVFVYCGGLQKYQRFDDTVSAFLSTSMKNPNARLLVLSPDKNAVEQKIGVTLPPSLWQAYAAPLELVNGYLNAADAAFLLRHDTPTNWSASPTKFAEYCLAGLPVVMTKAVRDAYEIALEHGTLIDFDETNARMQSVPSVDRIELSERFRKMMAKTAFLDTYVAIYSLRPCLQTSSP